jgi:hypothetical protein
MHIGDQIEIRVIPNIFMKIAAIYNLRAAIRVSDFEHSRALSDRQEHRQDTSFNFKPPIAAEISAENRPPTPDLRSLISDL